MKEIPWTKLNSAYRTPFDPRSAVESQDWDEIWEFAQRGATVSLFGTLVESPAKGQPIELVVESYKCYGRVLDAESYLFGTRAWIRRDTLRQVPHIKGQTMRCNPATTTAIKIAIPKELKDKH